MERTSFLEQELKTEKGQMKKRLWDWGQALEQCAWKQEELKKLKGLWEMQKKIWEGDETERGKRNLKRMERDYEEAVKRLRLELEEILRKKEEMDEWIEKLLPDEQMFVRMRFEKGYGFRFIELKMHLSRATLFRMQEKILQKLILEEKLRLSEIRKRI